MKILSILLLVFCLIHFSKQTNNQKIFIFGQNSVPQNCSDPDYNRLLSDHYSSILISRTTCNNVTECYSSDLVRSQRTQGLVVNMLGQVSNLTNDTLSEWVAWNLTLEYTTDEHRGWPLQELAFDDFFGHFKNWDISTRGLTLWKIISEIHRSNLKFGITVYVEEIDDILTWLPDSDLRDLIDVIHLYVKCAINGPEFDNNNYVANITSLFPNAEIILGIYAYPRMTLSNVCVFNESLKDPADLGLCNHTIVLEVAACYQNYTNYTESFCYCTDFQQIKYFNETLALQMNHWANGTVHGIEIYDAGWGLENTTSYCNGSASCVEIREKMRDILLTFNLTDVPPPQSPLKRGFHYIDNDEL